MGRKSKQVYEYDFEGKFIQSYESISEFRQKHYTNDIGNRPLFKKSIEGHEFHVSPQDTIAFTERVHRDRILFILRIYSSTLCNLNKTEQSKKSIEMLNLKNEVIAEFQSLRMAELLLKDGFNRGTIYSQLTDRSLEGVKGIGNDYYFRYKQI